MNNDCSFFNFLNLMKSHSLSQVIVGNYNVLMNKKLSRENDTKTLWNYLNRVTHKVLFKDSYFRMHLRSEDQVLTFGNTVA
jgi:hypothetical protein